MAEAKGLNYKGSMNGDIKTPMCAENVDNQGDPKVHTYKDIPSKGDGGGGSETKGPGAQGKWTASIKISGSNTGKY